MRPLLPGFTCRSVSGTLVLRERLVEIPGSGNGDGGRVEDGASRPVVAALVSYGNSFKLLVTAGSVPEEVKGGGVKRGRQPPVDLEMEVSRELARWGRVDQMR